MTLILIFYLTDFALLEEEHYCALSSQEEKQNSALSEEN